MLQISVNIADQESIERVLPVALEAGVGVIARRPAANVAWRTAAPPDTAYHRTYLRRWQRLRYDSLGRPLGEAVSTALRFALAQSGVHTAIVGAARPGRRSENASRLEADGPLSPDAVAAIRERWRQVAEPDWVGDT